MFAIILVEEKAKCHYNSSYQCKEHPNVSIDPINLEHGTTEMSLVHIISVKITNLIFIIPHHIKAKNN